MIINVTRHTNQPDGSIRKDYFGTYHSVDSLNRFMPPRFVRREDGAPICTDVVYTFADASSGKAIDDPRPIRVHDRKVQAYDGRYFRRMHRAFARTQDLEAAALASARDSREDD